MTFNFTFVTDDHIGVQCDIKLVVYRLQFSTGIVVEYRHKLYLKDSVILKAYYYIEDIKPSKGKTVKEQDLETWTTKDSV